MNTKSETSKIKTEKSLQYWSRQKFLRLDKKRVQITKENNCTTGLQQS